MKKPHKAKPRHKHRQRGTPAPARARALPAASRSPAPAFAIRFDKFADLLPSWPARPGAARAVAGVYGSDERQALALLLLPFFLLAFAIGINQAIRPWHRSAEFITPPFTTSDAARHRVRLPAAEPGHLARPALDSVPAATTPPQASVAERTAIERGPVALPASTATQLRPSDAGTIEAARVAPMPEIATTRAAREAITIAALQERPPGVAQVDGAGVTAAAAPAPLLELVPAVPMQTASVAATPAPMAVTALTQTPPAVAAVDDRVASLTVAPANLAPHGVGAPVAPEIAILAHPYAPPAGPNICALADVTQPSATGDASLASDPAAFGARLAQAARAQVDDLVIYNDAYRRISYPLGDVPALFGVCTDVVIRAYRALGVDLQALVHTSRTGSGDTNIDHRRVETLRRFFISRGTSLPVTDFAEDYRAGDIVTYYRPQNRHSRSHIAIVSGQTGPSGRPMILHNRGWGVQLEDGLFVDQITGHYRFAATPTPVTPAAILKAEGSGLKAEGSGLKAEGSGSGSPGAVVPQASRAQAAKAGRVTLCPVSQRSGLRSRKCVPAPASRVRQAGHAGLLRTQ